MAAARSRSSFCQNSGVSSSASAVLVPFSIVPTSPSLIMQRLATNCDVVVIVGGSTLCVFSSCMYMFGSTLLTQISSVSSFSLLSDFVCVAIVVIGVSVWVACVVFKQSSFEVVVSPKIIF